MFEYCLYSVENSMTQYIALISKSVCLRNTSAGGKRLMQKLLTEGRFWKSDFNTVAKIVLSGEIARFEHFLFFHNIS